MNLIKQKNIAQRNITPNFIRFRRNNSGKQGKSNSNKPTTPEDIKGE